MKKIVLIPAATLLLSSCMFEPRMTEVEQECLDMYHQEVFRDAQCELVVQDVFQPMVEYFTDKYIEEAADSYADPLLSSFEGQFAGAIIELASLLDGNSKSTEELIYEKVEEWGDWSVAMIEAYSDRIEETVKNLDDAKLSASEADSRFSDINEDAMKSKATLKSLCEIFFSTPDKYESLDTDQLLADMEELTIAWLRRYNPVVPELIKKEYYGDSSWLLYYDDGTVKIAEFIEDESNGTWVRVNDADPRFY